MSPSLTITSPTADVTVERGGQLSVTWEGVLVPRVAVVLTPRNYDHDATTTLTNATATSRFNGARITVISLLSPWLTVPAAPSLFNTAGARARCASARLLSPDGRACRLST